jgi:hypothetical protein
MGSQYSHRNPGTEQIMRSEVSTTRICAGVDFMLP